MADVNLTTEQIEVLRDGDTPVNLTAAQIEALYVQTPPVNLSNEQLEAWRNHVAPSSISTLLLTDEYIEVWYIPSPPSAIPEIPESSCQWLLQRYDAKVRVEERS
jgi:hypothetical protein